MVLVPDPPCKKAAQLELCPAAGRGFVLHHLCSLLMEVSVGHPQCLTTISKHRKAGALGASTCRCPVFLLGAVGWWCWSNITIAGVVGNVMASPSHDGCSTSAGIYADPASSWPPSKARADEENHLPASPTQVQVNSPNIRADLVLSTREGQNSFLRLGFQMGPRTTAKRLRSLHFVPELSKDQGTVENREYSDWSDWVNGDDGCGSARRKKQ